MESIKVESKEMSNKHIEQFYKLVLLENPDYFKYENPNSNLFVNEDNLTKSTSQTLYAQGYDLKNILNKFSLTFGFPRAGLMQGVAYYTELCEYIKYVEIPKGYSIAIPSPKPPIMIKSANTKSIYDSNMGYIPNTSSFNIGYTIKYISTYGNKDKYAFITHVEEISKNLQNNQKLNPIVYNPDDVTNPTAFKFAYQVGNYSW
ncbi:MAG: hypothetical protein LBQ74_06500 [Prevotella sp.]|nr:hypothetical protein [Prevotella sp.]